MGNGFATLFEDEVVLCGDGRLKEGIYKFQFELQLPPHNLPSSITVRASCAQCLGIVLLTVPVVRARNDLVRDHLHADPSYHHRTDHVVSPTDHGARRS